MNGYTHLGEPPGDESTRGEMFELYISRLRQLYSQKQVDPLLATRLLSSLERLIFHWGKLQPKEPKDPPPPLDYKQAKKIRKNAKINITQLVILLGHPDAQSYISRYESGKVNPVGSTSPVARSYLDWLSEHGYQRK